MSAQVIAALRKRADALEAEREPYGYGPECGLNRWLAAEFRKLANEAEGREMQTGPGQEQHMVKDPERGDFVKLSGKVLSIYEGTALVEVYRSDPVGLRVAVQCGALEHVEPVVTDDPVATRDEARP